MAEFKRVLDFSELTDGSARTVNVDGQAIALFRDGDKVFALQNACPHRGGPLGEGDVSGGQVTCPWHGWQFSLESGACAHNPASARVYPAKIESGAVWVAV